MPAVETVTVCHLEGDYSKQGDYARITKAQYDADPSAYRLYDAGAVVAKPKRKRKAKPKGSETGAGGE